MLQNLGDSHNFFQIRIFQNIRLRRNKIGRERAHPVELHPPRQRPCCRPLLLLQVPACCPCRDEPCWITKQFFLLPFSNTPTKPDIQNCQIKYRELYLAPFRSLWMATIARLSTAMLLNKVSTLECYSVNSCTEKPACLRC